MFLVFFLMLSGCSVCYTEDDDVGYSLNIGYSVDVFANYGDLSQVTQVISADYDEDFEGDLPFREKNLKVFEESSSHDVEVTDTLDEMMNMLFCDTYEDLLDNYFKEFQIEGTTKPWKAFMGDWIPDEIMRSFGLEYEQSPDNCCYVLAKLSKIHQAVKLDTLTEDIELKNYVQRAVNNLNASDIAEVRQFMKSYGTHYVDSYSTGNSIYQVFKYKRMGYNMLKSYLRKQPDSTKRRPDNIRFYFSSLFLKQVGDIRVASGNKTVEKWARKNLRDSQYLYSRPTLLKLYYSPSLINKLDELLDNGALLSIDLKTLKPLFKDREKGEKYLEIVENDMKLWEVNT